MNQWSIRRKRIILTFIFFALVVLIGVPTFFLFYRAPTCFDGRQNGDETGLNCGGSCQLLCTAESLPLILKGDPRVLRVSDNVFNVVALLENPNVNGEIYRARYKLKIFAISSAIPIKEIEGEAFVPRGSTLAIFEGPFELDIGINPVRAALEWETDSLIWQKNNSQIPELRVASKSLSREENSPRLDVIIENQSLESASNIDIIVFISDETGSIFAASKTFITTLPAGGRSPIVFTWPEPFAKRAIDTNIIVRVLPDQSFLK